MVQKEVGERICAGPGKMSVLAVSVQYYASPELLFIVPKEAFDPVPKVESAFIRITNKTENGEWRMENREVTHNLLPTTYHLQPTTFNLPSTTYNLPPERKEFFRVVKVGFSARRKTLVNNLANGFQLEKNIVEKLLEEVGIPVKARAQDLSVEEWKALDKNIETVLKSNGGGV
jgi:16S rRNA (adenine1518-N6/adenine1519-N6)-dimethyltransferase